VPTPPFANLLLPEEEEQEGEDEGPLRRRRATPNGDHVASLPDLLAAFEWLGALSCDIFLV